ncbi:MAG: chloride channel protein [Terriglobales bacterium]
MSVADEQRSQPAVLSATKPPRSIFSQISFREERFFLVLAILIGILSGLAVVCFRIAIEWSRLVFLGPGATPSGWRVIAAPVLVGLAVAALVILAFPSVRGSGVNQTKAALYIYNGFIPFKTAIGKFITSAMAIGAGQSLGPEDPSLQIGAALASALGRRLRLSREKLRLIAPVGAAAGLAAAFNAPISAVLFVIEEVIGRWSAGILGAVVLSAISSVMVTRWFLGAAPLFRIPAMEPVHPSELVAYAILGIVGGLASIVFARGIGVLRPRLKRAPGWTQYFQPAVAGLIIGLIGYIGFPQVMGAGYDAIDRAMHGQFTWEVLGALAGLKILSTTMSFVSGTPGGMFAPTLFIGAMLGGAVGGVERMFFPAHLAGTVATYALVGMGVLFAGFLRAPMTSVFMVLEVSGNYSIIVPVMIANTLAYLISRTFVPVPIFDLLSRQDGIELPSMEEERELPILRVEDAMEPPAKMVLNGSETVASAVNCTDKIAEENFLAYDPEIGWGVVSREALRSLAADKQAGSVPVKSVYAENPVPHLFPDSTLEMALRYVYDWPLLPVVHRADLSRLEGILSVQSVLRKYRSS